MVKSICHHCHWKGGIFIGKKELSEISCPRCFYIGFLTKQEAISFKVSSQRSFEFLHFASLIIQHIENYTIPQYGDAPNDQISEWSTAECVLAIKKRVSRFGRNTRKGQDRLDLFKIAHEACLAYFKCEEDKIPYVQLVNEEDKDKTQSARQLGD